MCVCLCVRVCVEHVYRQRQLAGVSSLCTASWVWTSVLRLGHKSLNSQPLAGSDFGFWKVLTWLLGPVIWSVQGMFILVRRICIGLLLNGRCFLEQWVSPSVWRPAHCTGDHGLLQPFLPSGQSLTVQSPCAVCTQHRCCFLWIDLSYQPPSALPYQSPKPVSVS